MTCTRFTTSAPVPRRSPARRLPRVGVVALITLGWGAMACGPQVRLQQPRSYSAGDVKLTLWYDRCGLQGFFASKPPPNPVVEERGWTERIMPGVLQQRGYVTLRIEHERQRRWFRRLLRRYYRAVPGVPRAEAYQVTVQTTRSCNKPRMRRGTYARVRVGDRELTLAYHPCLAQYLLNADLYQTRAKLIAEGEIDTVVAQKKPESRATVAPNRATVAPNRRVQR